jgi:HAE1 family hydrophobic/amphiphilic exporter-1
MALEGGARGEATAAHAGFNPIVRFAVEHRVTMAMAVLGVVVLGWLSLTRLPLEFLPSFSATNISVQVPYPSASPSEVEQRIVRPLEDSLGTINGLETMQAIAAQGSATFNITFVVGTDMDLASVDVRDRIDRVRDRLPADVEQVRIRRFQSTDIPILRSSISAPMPRDEFYDFVERTLQPRLERIDGVAQVSVQGVRSRDLLVELIPARVEGANLDIRQLSSTLRENHVNVSGGTLREGSQRYLVRTVGELDSLQAIRALPIRADGLRLGDVATVSFDYPRRTSYSYLNGEDSVAIAINKASTANLLEVVNRVKEEYERVALETPGFVVRHFQDNSLDVRKGLGELVRAGLVGGGLAILFTYFFLRKFRTTLLIAVAIPLSLIATFVILYLARQSGITEVTLNVMSLMGLMLAVGMLLDNSIVVIESIFRHRSELGEDARTASLRGASEVALPIVASTATTVCVFLPMLFMPAQGPMGQTRDVGTSVVVVMLASLLVALTVVPMFAQFLLRSETQRRFRLLERATDFYAKVIGFTLRHRLAFAVVAILLLVGSMALYLGGERTSNPPSQGRQVNVLVDVPSRLSPAQREEIFGELYGLLDANREEWEIADIAHQYETSGGRSRGRGGGGRSNRFELFLSPEEEAIAPTAVIIERIREALPVRAGVVYKMGQSSRGPPGQDGSSIRLELIGEDLLVLERLAGLVQEQLAQLPFLRDVDSSLESGTDEIRVSVDRERALGAGLSTQAVAQTVSNALSSRNLAYYKTGDREVGLVMQYREEDRQTLDQLQRMPVFASDGRRPVGSIADFAVERGALTIEREDRRPKLEITANVAGGMPSFRAMAMVQQAIGGFALPVGYEWRFGRDMRNAQADMGQSSMLLVFAVVLVYMIMASLFENFLQPLVILLSIPFSFIGVGLALELAGQARSPATDMGLIILAGIVVNNAIVLIDHINHLRREGLSRREAVILGGRHRLRPIVMTACTTMLSLSPMVAPFVLPQVFGLPEGRAAFWAPVGLVILGGLATSTFLTLLVTPTLYTLVDDLSRFARRLARAVSLSS